jgi:RNA polymerase sigma factor (sigma-70 family)
MTPEPSSETVVSGGQSAAGAATEDEQRLIAAILRKDRKAAARFIDEYVDSVYGYVRHRLSPRTDLVDDVVQDVFVAALEGLPSFLGTSPLRSWLLGIARHKVETYYREQLRRPEFLADGEATEAAAGGPAVDELIDRERMESKTHQILTQLPEPYGVALLWRYWENRTVREMAAATGKTEKAMERLLARARARFRALWERV